MCAVLASDGEFATGHFVAVYLPASVPMHEECQSAAIAMPRSAKRWRSWDKSATGDSQSPPCFRRDNSSKPQVRATAKPSRGHTQHISGQVVRTPTVVVTVPDPLAVPITPRSRLLKSQSNLVRFPPLDQAGCACDLHIPAVSPDRVERQIYLRPRRKRCQLIVQRGSG
jgi:hypothetical protein